MIAAEELRSRLIGAWTLVSYESADLDGGNLRCPLGADARGVILYTADGYMSAQIMRSDRTPFAEGDPHVTGDDEFSSAAKEYLAYSGPYAVLDGGVIAHHVDVSLLPNWIGGIQYRAAHLDDVHLELAPARPIVLEGRLRKARLVWRRATPHPSAGG